MHDDGGTSVPVKEATQLEDIHPPAITVSDRAASSTASAYAAPTRAVREPTTRITVDMPDSLHRKISMLSVEDTPQHQGPGDRGIGGDLLQSGRGGLTEPWNKGPHHWPWTSHPTI